MQYNFGLSFLTPFLIGENILTIICHGLEMLGLLGNRHSIDIALNWSQLYIQLWTIRSRPSLINVDVINYFVAII